MLFSYQTKSPFSKIRNPIPPFKCFCGDDIDILPSKFTLKKNSPFSKYAFSTSTVGDHKPYLFKPLLD